MKVGAGVEACLGHLIFKTQLHSEKHSFTIIIKQSDFSPGNLCQNPACATEIMLC